MWLAQRGARPFSDVADNATFMVSEAPSFRTSPTCEEGLSTLINYIQIIQPSHGLIDGDGTVLVYDPTFVIFLHRYFRSLNVWFVSALCLGTTIHVGSQPMGVKGGLGGRVPTDRTDPTKGLGGRSQSSRQPSSFENPSGTSMWTRP